MIDGADATLPEQVEMLVIGGGTIGLPLALGLAEGTGRPVLCLESGGTSQEGDTQKLLAADQLGAAYAGAESGRFRGLGGTSAHWGGALIPFQPADMEGWPVSWDDLRPHLGEVEAMFGLEAGPYDGPASLAAGGDMVARLAKWPPFARRNVWQLLRSRLRASPSCRIACDSHVTAIAPESDAIRVTVWRGGRSHVLRAGRVVIAAGAIETTRLALLLDRAMGGAVSSRSPALGRTFADHLSLAVGRIAPHDRAALNRMFGFRFGPSGTMRNLRFELAPDTPHRRKVRPGFVHIGYETDGDGGFDHLRALMQAAQRGGLPDRATLSGLVRNLPWVLRAAKWRFVDKRQLFPDAAELQAHAVIEQGMDDASRITLSETGTDAFGTPLPAIDWRVTPGDVAQLHALTDLFARHWADGPLSALGSFHRYDPATLGQALVHSGGIYHPVGSTRMARSASEGVVDADLRLFAEPRIQLASTSVLPSAGGANPTMTALLLAMRLVGQHGGRVSSQGAHG